MTFTHTLLAIALAFTSTAHAKLEAHEWGTFTSLVGSDGITQDGMLHEDEKLPSFVYGFGETRPTFSWSPNSKPTPRPTPPNDCRRNKGSCFSRTLLSTSPVTQKMETPVIYFYTDRPQRVDVTVKFPQGVITETFPAPVASSPSPHTMTAFANGETKFSVDVLTTSAAPPYADADNIYSHARNVASRTVRSGADVEKFIFYRGVGRFQPRFAMTSVGGRLSFSAAASAIPQAAFLVHVDDKGDGRMINLANLSKKGSQVVSKSLVARLMNHDPVQPWPPQPDVKVLAGTSATKALTEALVTSGLFADEAAAMVKTWEHGYLKVPGLRLLYILPRTEVDEVLPLTMTPAPEKLERVFVGRIEILLDTEEERILREIAAPSFDLDSLGRFAEPILRRAQQVYLNQVRTEKRTEDAALALKLQNLIETAANRDIVGTLTAH
ncbi:MAG: hypothetical protein V4760_14920 [Bdellovibrionota bacterium]